MTSINHKKMNIPYQLYLPVMAHFRPSRRVGVWSNLESGEPDWEMVGVSFEWEACRVISSIHRHMGGLGGAKGS